VIERDIACDIEHPGFKAAFATKTRGSFENFQENVLCEVFAQGSISRYLQAKLIDASMMSLEQCCETRWITVGDPLNQLFICHSLHGKILDYGDNDDRRAETLQDNAKKNPARGGVC